MGNHTSTTKRRDREKPVLSVTLADCVVKASSSGGPGGQNVNRRSTKIQILHEPSGARGESSEERSQLENKRRAIVRMCQTAEFKAWVRRQAGEDVLAAVAVERELWPDRTLVEVKDEDGNWVTV